MNLGFFTKFKIDFSVALAAALGKLDGDTKSNVETLINKFKESAKVISNLYGFLDTLTLYINENTFEMEWPLIDELDLGYAKFNYALDGVVPMGDFWVMGKL